MLLTRGDDADALKIGRLAGANAIVIGEVQQWETDRQQGTNRVSLSWRMVDVETGQLLFNGEGYGSDATGDEPENVARKTPTAFWLVSGSRQACSAVEESV
jgi:curli biogenesis system outer membrane secretion channel CsgG